MPTHHYQSYTVDVDQDGYLADPSQWSPELADAIAQDVGLGSLTQRHWKVINFCRDDAEQHGGASPGLRRISKACGVPIKELYTLFPKGPGKLAALVAGLKKPKSCI